MLRLLGPSQLVVLACGIGLVAVKAGLRTNLHMHPRPRHSMNMRFH
jgi:hypothetical protein